MNELAAKAGMGAALVLVAAVGLYYLSRVAPGAIAGAGRAIDPTNPDNVFAQGANAIARQVTGDASATTGTAIHDAVNPQFQKMGDWLAAPVTFANGRITSPVPEWIQPQPGLPVSNTYAPTLPDFPTAFDAPVIYTGPGGAAFGLYSRP